LSTDSPQRRPSKNICRIVPTPTRYAKYAGSVGTPIVLEMISRTKLLGNRSEETRIGTIGTSINNKEIASVTM
jgi:hypothetical protein